MGAGNSSRAEELYGVVETSSPIRQLARHCPHQYPSSSAGGRCCVLFEKEGRSPRKKNRIFIPLFSFVSMHFVHFVCLNFKTVVRMERNSIHLVVGGFSRLFEEMQIPFFFLTIPRKREIENGVGPDNTVQMAAVHPLVLRHFDVCCHTETTRTISRRPFISFACVFSSSCRGSCGCAVALRKKTLLLPPSLLLFPPRRRHPSLKC